MMLCDAVLLRFVYAHTRIIIKSCPGGLKKVREANRKRILQFSSESDWIVPTYDQKA